MFEIEPDELDLSSEESVRGRKAKIRGTLTGALLGVLSDGVRARGYGDNTWTIDGGSVRFHSLNKGKKSFTFNPVSEPDNIIIAFSRDEVTSDQPLKCAIYGVKLVDCKRVGRAIESKTNPGRVGVHLSAVGKVRLGTVYLPAKFTEVETAIERDAVMRVIDALTPTEMAPMMDSATRANIREFVSEAQKATTSAIAPVASPVAGGPGPTPEQVHAEEVVTAAPSAEEMAPAAATDPASALPIEEAPAATGSVSAPSVEEAPVVTTNMASVLLAGETAPAAASPAAPTVEGKMQFDATDSLDALVEGAAQVAAIDPVSAPPVELTATVTANSPASPTVDEAAQVSATDTVSTPRTEEALTVAGVGSAAAPDDEGPQITDPSALPPGGRWRRPRSRYLCSPPNSRGNRRTTKTPYNPPTVGRFCVDPRFATEPGSDNRTKRPALRGNPRGAESAGGAGPHKILTTLYGGAPSRAPPMFSRQ